MALNTNSEELNRQFGIPELRKWRTRMVDFPWFAFIAVQGKGRSICMART